MDANFPKKPRSQREQKSSWRQPENGGFAKMEPANMGLEMPDWLTANPAGDKPREALPPEAPTPNTCPQARTVLEGMKVVCICKGIRKSVFWKVLDQGACTKEDVNRLTGSGSGGCQGRRCGPRIIDMLRDLCGSQRR